MWYVHHLPESMKTPTRWLGTSCCSTHAVKVASRSAGYDCVNNATVGELKGGDPRTDHTKKGDDSDPGLASRGVSTLRVCRPADCLLPGTVGQWPPATGQWWNARRGGDPKTDQVTQGADSELLGWQPKEKASQLPQKEVL